MRAGPPLGESEVMNGGSAMIEAHSPAQRHGARTVAGDPPFGKRSGQVTGFPGTDGTALAGAARPAHPVAARTPFTAPSPR